MRMVVLLFNEGPQLYRTVWRIPKAGNVADNFWRAGNLLCDVDIQTGNVGRMAQSYSGGFNYLDSDNEFVKRFRGHQVPDWEAAVALCLKASAAFPGLRMQYWDVALTDRGPILQEVNVVGSISLVQTVATRGLLDKEFWQLCKERNVSL